MSVLPLARYRVLDFGTAWAGAMVGLILAHLGAEVIRIESRERIDGMRLGWPGKGAPPEPEFNAHFHVLNPNKLSITANMKQPEGVTLIKELVKECDVVTDNFTPGVLERVGLDYESLRAVKPDIILVSIPAAGNYGPLKDVRTYASTLGALAGIEGLVGYPGERVLSLGGGYADTNGGVHGAMAILVALLHRNRMGEGQFVDLSQWEATTSLLVGPIMEYIMNGRNQAPQGNLSPTMVPYNNYACKGEDTWVSIAVYSDEEWQGLCRAMGEPAWTKEERFSDKYSRLKNRQALDELIAAWTSNLTHYEATEVLQRAGVAAAPLLNVDERHDDPHFRERQLYIDMEHPRTGVEPVFDIPWKLSGTPGAMRRHSPLLGEHNEYVFTELLGLSKGEVARLTEAKALY
ncbi:MAG: CoA transferase [Chloroflexi bacterium]|nr:CoA transferase [Chloroflexota bacterium]